MVRQWVLTGQGDYKSHLVYKEDVVLPEPGPKEVLVSMRAASLNYRDLMISEDGGIHGKLRHSVVPGCDGAGVVEAVGSNVSEFKPGDKVVTFVGPLIAEKYGDDGHASVDESIDSLGEGPDGTLCSKGIFSEKALVHAPSTLDWAAASTLPCTFLTAWNALYGLEGKGPGPGSWVLILGTGGVSIAALQISVAAGANVVATTSSEDKVQRLRDLGAAHVINYRTNPDNWGQLARDLTPGKLGFDVALDIAGDATLSHCVTAVKTQGLIAIAGMVGEQSAPVPMMAAFYTTSLIVRGVIAGTRNQFKDVVKFVDEKKLKPAVDSVTFELAETKEAYTRLKEQKHFAKIVIEVR